MDKIDLSKKTVTVVSGENLNNMKTNNILCLLRSSTFGLYQCHCHTADDQLHAENCSRQFYILKDSLIISLIVFEKENIAREMTMLIFLVEGFHFNLNLSIK
ncbi:hypothetical protein T02_16130 [Trichinella nativa]|uniref:Uncharacterized protein n=1 Tax=Trichinella nativa TaxID=6335 RepID=A0A0V1KPP7_9BILA|nr:hypothetical protein T02_16130 [Trichinella nativa]